MAFEPGPDDIHRAEIEIQGRVDKEDWDAFKKAMKEFLTHWRGRGVPARLRRIHYIKKHDSDGEF